jgi:hypothetical protein
MASSQIACVNFLLPLASNPAALTTILQSLDHDVISVVELEHHGRKSYVEFEWVGMESTLELGAYTRGANATSVDALLVAETTSGRRAYVLEWKYVENYPKNESKAIGNSGKTRLDRYTPLYCADSSPFKGVIPVKSWLFEPFYQIMRLLLLGNKMISSHEFGVKQAKVVVVCPVDNLQYRERITSPDLSLRYPDKSTVEEVVRAGLKDEGLFTTTCCAEFLKYLRKDFSGQLADWLAYHQQRYGW